MRRCLTTALSLLALGAPLLLAETALAQENPNCPPGAWFCEETDVPAPPADAAPAQPPPAQRAQPGDAPKAPPARGSTTVVIPPPPPGRHAAPPVVIYQPVPSSPPPQVVIVAPGAYPPPAYPVRAVPPPPKKGKPYVWRKEWGLNLRLEGVALGQGKGADERAGMGGMGISLRYRPVPAFAFEAGVDLLGGIDYNGFERTEVPISVGGILFVNPKSRVQFYFTGGVDWSHANVESDTYSPLLMEDGGYQTEYSYFGGHGGIGLEFRLSRRVALNIDGLGFVRHRTDEGVMPEFIDERGRTTNASGGGLFRGGLTFWW